MVAVIRQLGLQSSEGLAGAGGSISKVLTHLTAKLPLAQVRGLSSSPCGSLHVTA